MKLIKLPPLALVYLTAFPLAPAHADRRIRIELPLPEHCAITDIKQPSGVCVRGPLHYRLAPGTGEVIWKELGDLEPGEFFRMLEEMSGGSSDSSGQ